MPDVLVAACDGRAVGERHLELGLLALRVDTDDLRRLAVCPEHAVAGVERADGDEGGGLRPVPDAPNRLVVEERLAASGASGQDGELAVERCVDGAFLLVGELRAVLGEHLVDCTGEGRARGELVGTLGVPQCRLDGFLGGVQVLQVDAVPVLDEFVVLDEPVERLLDDAVLRLGDDELLVCELEQHVPRHERVAVALAAVTERGDESCLQAARVVSVDMHLLGDLVGAGEREALDLAQDVRVLLDDLCRLRPVLSDHRVDGRVGDAEVGEEGDDVAVLEDLRERLDHPLDGLLSDAFDHHEALGMLLQHLEGVVAERLVDSLRGHRTDARDGSAAEEGDDGLLAGRLDGHGGADVHLQAPLLVPDDGAGNVVGGALDVAGDGSLADDRLTVVGCERAYHESRIAVLEAGGREAPLHVERVALLVAGIVGILLLSTPDIPVKLFLIHAVLPSVIEYMFCRFLEVSNCYYTIKCSADVRRNLCQI